MKLLYLRHLIVVCVLNKTIVTSFLAKSLKRQSKIVVSLWMFFSVEIAV